MGVAGRPDNPWRALWAMLIGFFMILVDSTIVAVANPTLQRALGIADYDTVLWITSAYLLGYAVPLLLAGRLGDQYGVKNMYLLGLAVFTLSSLWCGLSDSVGMLIAARVVQGVGAALLTPQTLSTITRIFPPDRRGVAMSIWGATAGVATLVGPLAGGALLDWGWQWIFFVNVPIGVIGLVAAYLLVPALPTRRHRFDLIGVALSGLGMFCLVFGLQEGQKHDWAPWVWLTIAAGVAIFAGFVYWQSVNPHEPLVPLRIFRDRNFTLSNVGIAVIGFVVTGMVIPVLFYAQTVCGLSPIRSALLTAPMAVATGVLAPVVGRIVDRAHPTPIIGSGFSILAVALSWLSVEMNPDTPIWRLALPFAVMGAAMAFIWSPLAATATRDLPPEIAGAGSGVYNATRQVGSVLGSAAMAAFMTAQISAEVPGAGGGVGGEGQLAQLPPVLRDPFATAFSQSALLPAMVSLAGVVAALFFVGSVAPARRRPPPKTAGVRANPVLRAFQPTDVLPRLQEFRAPANPAAGRRRPPARPPAPGTGSEPRTDRLPQYFDDDDYVVLALPPPAPPVEDDTEPLGTRVEFRRHRPVPVQLGPRADDSYELLHNAPLEELLDDAAPHRNGRNGSHVPAGDVLQPVPRPRHGGRHARPDDDAGYGRHAARD
ncbi:MFS transporter [Mycobacterium sp. MYCO198283]|uniref:MFS transporter n=1 Tax=Mycobacterium sp. MYCO198283 TaxID=2883505 RepID=UPI001E33F867|nr:MFS transporter [Mycobacterium sp. MYCO198283]MCG5430752.1 MFS transporter [Mycobacterium sp. MYCO198283]